MGRDIKQGDILKVNLDPTLGHEQRGYRPVLVVSNDDFNAVCGGMIKIVSITSNEKEFPLHVKLPDGLPIHGKVLLDQERTIDSSYREYKYVCSVPDEFMDEIIEKQNLTYKKSR